MPTPQYIMFLVSILIGSVTWAMVVGTICGMMATADPHKIAFRQQMDSLNYFLKDMEMPEEIKVSCRQYVRNKREVHKQQSYDELVDWLSPGLRGPVLLHMCGRALRNVWYLNELNDPDCLVKLAMCLQRAAYPARERIPALDTLKIILKGIAAKGGAILYGFNFDMWGEDIILHAQVLRDKRYATALTYVEVDTLSRNDLYDVLEDFPQAAASVKDSAIRVALKRTVRLIKAYTDRRALEVASEKENKASLMLKAAFSDPFDPSMDSSGVEDPGKIFRLITGGAFRDVDEHGNLVETVIREEEDTAFSEPSRHSPIQSTAGDDETEQAVVLPSHPNFGKGSPRMGDANGEGAKTVKIASRPGPLVSSPALPPVTRASADETGGSGGGMRMGQVSTEEWKAEVTSLRSEMAQMRQGLTSELTELRKSIADLAEAVRGNGAAHQPS